MPAEEAERVVAAMRWLVSTRYDGSQKALAEAIGVSPSAVGQHLNGRNRPSHENAIAVARICGTGVEALRSGVWTPDGGERAVEREPIDPRVPEFVRRRLVTHRAAEILGPMLTGVRSKTDAELLLALQAAETAAKILTVDLEEDPKPRTRRR